VVVGGYIAFYLGYIFREMTDKIWSVLKKIDDPELGVSLVGLGLIYDVKEKNGQVKIKMSLTSMGCPLFDYIENEIKEKVGKIKGVKKVEVGLVWDPPWNQGLMSEEVKAELGVD
jgi:metal-sulfur cluster biosynthetic enzyme